MITRRRFALTALPLAVVVAVAASAVWLRRAAATPVDTTCPAPLAMSSSGVCQLHGKVQFVKAFPKYKIQIVSAFPDIKVKRVNAFPDKPGEWQVVSAFPDFTVQVVDAFPDFKVQYVDAFPGCP